MGLPPTLKGLKKGKMLALITGGRVESEKASFKKLQVYLSKEHRKEHEL